jgi:hypothetical protein
MFVTEVHNFGGFFGGDTVTLSAEPWPAGEEITLTIDEKALENLSARHLVAPHMLFQFDFAGERIDRARLLAARVREELNQAIGDAPSTDILDQPRIRAYRCESCQLWVLGQPKGELEQPICGICDALLT